MPTSRSAARVRRTRVTSRSVPGLTRANSQVIGRVTSENAITELTSYNLGDNIGELLYVQMRSCSRSFLTGSYPGQTWQWSKPSYRAVESTLTCSTDQMTALAITSRGTSLKSSMPLFSPFAQKCSARRRINPQAAVRLVVVVSYQRSAQQCEMELVLMTLAY